MTLFTNNTRVKWIHDCPVNHPCGYDRGGTVWRPKPSELNDWQVADMLGLTADPQPDPDREFVMVAWDCRPGVLQVHYVDELEVAVSYNTEIYTAQNATETPKFCTCGHLAYWHTEMTNTEPQAFISVPCATDECTCSKYCPTT